MERYDGPLFDCDNHYYEAEDAFTRHVPKAMQPRCVQWVEMNGKRRHLVAGKVGGEYRLIEFTYNTSISAVMDGLK